MMATLTKHTRTSPSTNHMTADPTLPKPITWLVLPITKKKSC